MTAAVGSAWVRAWYSARIAVRAGGMGVNDYVDLCDFCLCLGLFVFVFVFVTVRFSTPPHL